ncbi:MAG: sulfite exporter TauE/SafE family protein [Verrucomicrobia bacterium]|nr:sulfite exporter TauE/SafE family protein [Verrucomicrobiota bacterium]
MTEEFLLYTLAGFVAQLIDGALGMAYGVTATSVLLTVGVAPVTASATVHAAECFSTGASALSHRAFGNISGFLFRQLVLPGILGAVLGACVLSSLPGDALKPYIAAYLLCIGLVIFLKAFRTIPSHPVTTHLKPLAFGGAFLDAIGGGGWGPIVSSNLIVRGNDVRETVGSVNAAEFFVALASSAVFVATLGLTNWPIIFGLALGGALAAPLGAWACHRLPVKPFMVLVGVLIMILSLRTLYLSLF